MSRSTDRTPTPARSAARQQVRQRPAPQPGPGAAAPPGADLLQLQRRYGNRYVQRVVSHAKDVDQSLPVPGQTSTGLPERLEGAAGNLSGLSLDDVRVHYNSLQPAGMRALAFTQGTEIHVGPGQEEHLAHEAWHVVQQKQGRVRPTWQVDDGLAVNDDAGLEREADVMGAKVVQLGRSHDIMTHPAGQLASETGPPSRVPMGARAGRDVVQRVIAGPRGQPETAANVLKRFKNHANYQTAYRLAQSPGSNGQPLMSDHEILAFVTALTTATEQYSLTEVYSAIAHEIHTRESREVFAPTASESGIDIQVKSTSHNLPIRLNVQDLPEQIDLHPQHDVEFKANVAASVPAAEQGDWEIGFVQTLLSAHRRLRIVNPGQVRTERVDVDEPHIDKREGPNPWYDAKSGSKRLSRDFELISELLLDDKPGFSVPKRYPTDRFMDSMGQDTFKTWLILRHVSGAPVRFLAQWDWRLEYDPSRADAGASGGPAGVDGSAAKLEGKRAKQDIGFAAQTIDIGNLPSPDEYDAMKKNATKKTTVGSGMMPRKVYRQRYNAFRGAFMRRDLHAAIAALQSIKADLDRMDAMGANYWISPSEKALHFNPLYDMVAHVLHQLRSV